jgi:hypothetical protein
MFYSTGIVRYLSPKVIAEVDPELVRYYRSLVPKIITLNWQMYDAHISVVRNETAKNLDFWGKREGCEFIFEYNGEIRYGEVYYWIDAFCEDFNDIREELGLERRKCFHVTLGNLKQIVQV